VKKSEMLSKIASVIINYNEAHCIINRDKAMEMAETILSVQEEIVAAQNKDIIKALTYYADVNNYYEDPEDNSILSMSGLDDLSKEPVTFGNEEIITWVAGRRARQILKEINETL
jgi:hypothetical protein